LRRSLPTPRLDALTGVRALAALWVVLYHYQPRIDQAFAPARHLDPLLSIGYLGVDLFFALSGFILAYTYFEGFRTGVTRAGYGRFLQLRLARMYPVHLFTLHIVVGLYLATKVAGIELSHPDGQDYGPLSYVANLGLVQNWFTPTLSWNGVAWSLSAEWAVYLVFPLGAFMLARYRSRMISVAGIVVCYGLMIWSYSTWLAAGESAANGMLVRVGCEFAAGCFLYRLFADTRSRAVATAAGWASVVLAAVIVAVPFVLTIDSYHRGLVWSPLLGLLIFTLAYQRGPLARVLSMRRVVFWGEASFALYMTHGLVEYVLNKLVPGSIAGDAAPVRIAVLAGLGLAVAATAAGTYLLIERPSRSWLRRLRVSRRPGLRPALRVELVPAESRA
jgi:peptidoglycan/LPS O-acetylase OafA/YrhL